MRSSKIAFAEASPEVTDRFNRVLGDTVEALESAGVRYAFIGGIASGGLGRPRSTHDIDVFVRPEDAETTIRALAKHGFRVERTDRSWLYKGFKENVLVDVIFKSKGEIYLDQEMLQRMITAEFHGKRLRFVAPEDLIIIKALAHGELTPGHWHDALALLSHASIDWDYLTHRARRAPRRILSLLLYAQSNDIWVPKQAIDRLYQTIFGDMPSVAGPQAQQPQISPSVPPASQVARPALRVVPKRNEEYATARLRERLAEDPRTNELDIQVEASEGKVLLRGEVLSEERRDAVIKIAEESFPGFQIENQIRVTNFVEPPETEEIR